MKYYCWDEKDYFKNAALLEANTIQEAARKWASQQLTSSHLMIVMPEGTNEGTICRVFDDLVRLVTVVEIDVNEGLHS